MYKKFIVSCFIIFLVFFIYKKLEYTNQFIFPQQTNAITVDKNIFMLITCEGDWIKNKYGPPYELLISIYNVFEHTNISVMQFSIVLNDHEVNIPVDRIKRIYIKDSHEIIFFYKYLNINFSSVEKIKYKITLSINNKIFEKVLFTKINNYSTKENVLMDIIKN